MPVAEAPASWDLSDLYAGPDDPKIDADCRTARERAQAFEEQFRGRIASEDVTAETLRAALDEYDQILRDLALPISYAMLIFNSDTSNPAYGALLQSIQLEKTAANRHLVFFDLEVGKMAEERFHALVADPIVQKYRHYLEHERKIAAHHLTEQEEKIADELANTGARAFARLFDEVTSRALFRVELPTGVEEMNESQAAALLYDPDRGVRRAAAKAITAGLMQNAHVLTFIFNNQLQHKATVDRLRRYEYPEEERHEDNEVDPQVVETVVDVAVANYRVVADYYRLKGKLLGIDRLTHYDRYAPLSRTESDISFSSAREMVLDAFGRFSADARREVDRFFQGSWIDAEVRPGKSGGAFCMSTTPDLHPYVFMNYTDKPRDVMVLAHELGHGLHGLLSAGNSYLDFHSVLPLSETASVFGEMLTFESLQQQISDPGEKLAMLCGKIEDTFATVFRQASMYRFEKRAHKARREEGELTTERYNAIWQSTMQEMFGDSLVLEEEHSCWWLYIPHIFLMPFYVYSYAFGELLVMSLYARYKQEGEPFVGKFMALLAAGGSRRPEELLDDLGIDIASRDFWQGGVNLIDQMVDRAYELAGMSR